MAVDSVTASYLIDIVAKEAFTAENDLGSIKRRIRRTFALPNGTSDGQCDLVWADRRSLAADTTETIDLDTSLTDSAGTAVDFAQVDLIVFINRNTVAGDDLHIGPNSSNGFSGPWADDSDRSVCPAGATSGAHDGMLIMANPQGWAVTGGTGDLIAVINIDAANAISYDVLILGRSA